MSRGKANVWILSIINRIRPYKNSFYFFTFSCIPLCIYYIGLNCENLIIFRLDYKVNTLKAFYNPIHMRIFYNSRSAFSF